MREIHGLVAVSEGGANDREVKIVDRFGDLLLWINTDRTALTPDEAEYLADQLRDAAARIRAAKPRVSRET
jgi:hypothetical protein